MNVVLPFCERDVDAMVRLLGWCIDMDIECRHGCVLSYEKGTDITAVENRARLYFTTVHLHEYFTPPIPGWPQAPNWAWQNTARFMYGLGSKEPWLWMEADVTPLVPRWIDMLQKEYDRGGQPFMGHVVKGSEDEHVNGVMIYPWNVADYSVKAMLCRAAPWDIVMSKDILPAVHPANKLMAHVPRFTGIALSVVDPEVPVELVKRGAVMFHGCNDGSLIQLLQGSETPEFNGEVRKVYGMDDIDAEFDEGEGQW